MGFLKNKNDERLIRCFNCDGTNFNLRDRSRIFENVGGKSRATNDWQVLLECQSCRFATTQILKSFPFEERLIKYLRQQKIVGSHKMKDDGYTVQERWSYPWDNDAKQYRFDKPRQYRR